MIGERFDGERWVPLEPRPEPFGILWERFWKFRMERGERRVPSCFRSFVDAMRIAEL